MFQSKNNAGVLASIISKDVEINGDINISGDILIYGKVTGNIHSTGIINTAKGSSIDGDIKAKNIFISGSINGNLNIANKAIIESSGELNGNIKAAIITIEEGACFDGMCNMLKLPNESTVKKITAI
tara:strand:- start:478 stop:858 length:381 start_codon:yes stop_codon:yes gene_type:complete